MKIDFLKEGAEDCPMIRLYNFRSAEVRLLKSTFEALAVGSVQQVRLRMFARWRLWTARA